MEDPLISIENKDIDYVGACNFCSRGVLSSGGYNTYMSVNGMEFEKKMANQYLQYF
jgi:hypothetical protein